jgi:[ribosomal protein S5]-alanine N-acetyltransferase
MSTAMPILETERLLVRPLVMDDLPAVHQLLDYEAWQTGKAPAEREHWLRWTVMNYIELSNLYQPPYGERAVVLKSTGELVGSVGVVQSLGPFGTLPSFGGQTTDPAARKHEPAMGLFWATRTAHQRKGYAAEAARAVIDFLFSYFSLRRIVATTEYDNLASQAVMRSLGMSVERNPFQEPVWFQVVGVLYNRA